MVEITLLKRHGHLCPPLYTRYDFPINKLCVLVYYVFTVLSCMIAHSYTEIPV
jgi:hypothetical protein